jgi:hypothetical protein
MAPDPALEKAIRTAVPDFRRAAGGEPGLAERSRYAYGRVDLNGDGLEETVVLLMGPWFCGTGGCSLQIFAAEASGGTATGAPPGRTPVRSYRLITDIPTTRPPVIISPRRTNGWRDLWRLQSGGGMPAAYVRHSFDGRRYVETERVPGQRRPEGEEVLSDSLTYEQALPLAPAP